MHKRWCNRLWILSGCNLCVAVVISFPGHYGAAALLVLNSLVLMRLDYEFFHAERDAHD